MLETFPSLSVHELPAPNATLDTAVPARVAEITAPKEMTPTKTAKALKGMVAALTKDMRTAGIRVEDAFLSRLLAALKTKRFAIMTGLSGSGKTKVAQAFANWLVADKGAIQIVPVAADWTSGEDLIGFPDALDKARYVSTATTKLLVSAAERPQVPHFLILDEMNLSHVERYFADFLSAMESGAALKFYEGDERSAMPCALERLPDNLFVIGTVNVDESTYMFSPKVLDRANVFEFRTSLDGLSSFLERPAAVRLERLAGKGARFADAFLGGTVAELEVSTARKRNSELELLHQVLGRFGAEFGFRTALDVCTFIRWHKLLVGRAWSFDSAVDAQIIQKVLPKVHGSNKTLSPILLALKALSRTPRTWSADGKIGNKDQLIKDAWDETGQPQIAARRGVEPPYPFSQNKIDRMLQRLEADGFASFAEA